MPQYFQDHFEFHQFLDHLLVYLELVVQESAIKSRSNEASRLEAPVQTGPLFALQPILSHEYHHSYSRNRIFHQWYKSG